MKPASLLFLIVCCSCSPYVPLQYNPTTHPRTFTSIETSDVTIYLENIGSKYQHLVFDLEVINHSYDTLEVHPQKIIFYASGKNFPQIKNSFDNVDDLSFPHSKLLGHRHYAKSPQAIKILYEEKMREKASASALLFILGAGLVIYDAVQDSKDSYKETWTKKDESRAIARDILVDAAFISADLMKQSVYRDSEDYYYLRHEIFPVATIPPQEKMRGKIFLPLELRYRFYRIVIPIGDVDYVFDFRKKSSVKEASTSQSR